VVGGQLSTKYFAEQEKQYAGMPEWVDLARIFHLKIYSSGDVDTVLAQYRNRL
jgi:hypothetical protein